MNTDYDDVLRQALHAAAESIEPSADGLERIRARTGRPHALSLATAAAWCSGIAIRLASWAGPVIAAAADFFWTAVDRFRPGAGPEHARVRYGWLRPVAAMGTAIFVVAAGAFAVMTLPGAITSSPISLPWTTNEGSSHAPGTRGLAGTGSALATGPSTAGVSGGAVPGVPTASASCHPSGGAGAPSSSPPATTTSPATSPPVSTPPATTTPPTTSTSPTDSPTTPSTSGSTTPDPGSAGTQTPAAQSPAAPTPAAGSGNGQDGTVAQAANVVPSKSKAPSPCTSPTAKASQPGATASGPSALDAARYAVGSGRQAPAAAATNGAGE
ncbi:MAG TPA: hypothetical protein VFV41_23235 [Streptosporangiaceae bacterium]|nr:hypothetical protein [Streptosporangiaceae bacterium]